MDALHPSLPTPLRAETLHDLHSLAQRYYLSPPVVAAARAVFDRYVEIEQERRHRRGRMMHTARSIQPTPKPPSPPPTKRITSPKGSPSPRSQRQTPPPAAAAAQPPRAETRAPPERRPQIPLLGVEGLQLFFRDMDAPMSSLEVAELVHTLRDEPMDFATLKQRRAMAAAVAAEALRAPPAKELKSGRNLRSPRRARGGSGVHRHDLSDASGGAEAPKRDALGGVVDFSLFLFILTQVVTEREDHAVVKEEEVRDLFARVDGNGDGCITHADVRAVVQQLADEGVLGADGDVQRVLAMSTVELDLALMECDVDGDGRVTFEDLYSALRS